MRTVLALAVCACALWSFAAPVDVSPITDAERVRARAGGM